MAVVWIFEKMRYYSYSTCNPQRIKRFRNEIEEVKTNGRRVGEKESRGRCNFIFKGKGGTF
jgi:hypothetical protein